jgi:hypothetical protein
MRTRRGRLLDVSVTNICRPLALSRRGPKKLAKVFIMPGVVCRIPRCGVAKVIKFTGVIRSNTPRTYNNPTTYLAINPPKSALTSLFGGNPTSTPRSKSSESPSPHLATVPTSPQSTINPPPTQPLTSIKILSPPRSTPS